MISILTTAALIVGVSAALTHQAHRRRKAAEAEVAVLEARDARRQLWINAAAELFRDVAWLDDGDQARGEWLFASEELWEEFERVRLLRELERGSADHQGALRIAEHRLACGMEVPT